VRAFAALFAFELRRQRLIFAAALAIGLLAAAIPQLPGVHTNDPGSTRVLASSLAAILFAAALAIGLGSTMLARDVVERGRSFFLARPVSTAALWASRLSVASVTILVAALLVPLPAFLLGSEFGGKLGVLPLLLQLADSGGPSRYLAWARPGVVIGTLALGLALLLLLANAIALAARSRTSWTGADLLWAAAGVSTFAVLFGRVRQIGSALGEFWVAEGAAIGTLLVLAISSAWQARLGRTDIERAHRAHSLTLGGGLLLLSGIGFAAVGAYLNPSIARIAADTYWLGSSTLSARWTVVRGAVAHSDLSAWYFVDTRSGRSTRSRLLGPLGGPGAYALATLSSESSTALQAEPVGGGATRVSRFDLAGPDPRPVESDLMLPEHTRRWVLSSDGRRILAIVDPWPGAPLLVALDADNGATLVAGRIIVDDAMPVDCGPGCAAAIGWGNEGNPTDPPIAPQAAWRLLPSASGAADPRRTGYWLDNRADSGYLAPLARVELHGREPARIVAVTPPLVHARRVAIGPGRERLLLLRAQRPALLLDAATLAPIPWQGGEAPIGSDWRLEGIDFLRDGTVLLARRSGDQDVLERFSKDGALLRSIALDSIGNLIAIEGATSENLVVVTTRRAVDEAEDGEWSIEALDWSTGSRRTLARGLRPLAAEYGPGILGPPLFYDAQGRMSCLDVETGAIHRVR
jgi:hypothetical protein